MKNKNKFKKINFRLLLLFPVILVVAVFLFLDGSFVGRNIQAQAASDDEKLEKKEDELETLEEKAENYQRMISLKKQQQMTLKNQLEMMDLQIENFQNDIALTQQNIERNKGEIQLLERQVEQKSSELNQVKGGLGEMIRIYNEIDNEIALEFLSSKGDISSFLNQSEYVDQTSQKVNVILQEIKTKREELESKTNEQKNKQDELQQKNADLKEKVYFIGNEKASKEILLIKTNGEEAQYKNLLERVEKQKLELIGDIESLSVEKRQELDDILESASTPKSGTASTKWYYSQKDSRWGQKRIGLSSSLMKDYGCAVTSLAMVFTYHNESITPGKLSSQPIFYQDLIVWPENWKDLKLVSTKAHSGVDWGKVKKEIEKDNPVIVFVRASSGAGHYVVVHGRDKNGEYVVHDPLFGPNIYLKTTQKLVGAIYNSSTTIDQMLIYEEN